MRLFCCLQQKDRAGATRRTTDVAAAAVSYTTEDFNERGMPCNVVNTFSTKSYDPMPTQ